MAVNGWLALILVYLFVTNLPVLALQQVDVTGTRHLQTEVVEAAQIDNRANLLTINLSAVARRVETHPWILFGIGLQAFPGCAAHRSGGKATRAMLTAGKLYYVDEEGEFFQQTTPR